MHSPTNIRIAASILALPLVLAACALPEILGGNTDLGASSDALNTTSEPSSDSSVGSSETATFGPTSASGSDTATFGPVSASESETATFGPVSASESDTATFGPVSASESDTASGTTGGPAMCDNPAHMCTIPVDCDEQNCGALGSPFDAEGCLRRSCDDAPCGPGEVCYAHDIAGGCSQTVVECFDIEGICACNLTDNCGGHYCYPAGEAPPADCHAITDQTTCLESGCGEFREVPTVSVVDQACTCGAAVPACLWFPGVPGVSGEDPGFYYDLSTHQVVRFTLTWADPPLGWAPCTGDPSEPAACACAAPGQDPCD
ncbi:hypothetical protein [Nannocystis pusilla]|uniref:EGF-like domain-containing protein n=1 Tax=Nannocystis pusilla TaxID=889268 RepID=A0ABS7TPR0_9BACT|nr:hypothetical protein [Nannocystis pusilla]MBZ5710170.1 hypothetical protein [Nannocystis pusilla]